MNVGSIKTNQKINRSSEVLIRWSEAVAEKKERTEKLKFVDKNLNEIKNDQKWKANV